MLEQQLQNSLVGNGLSTDPRNKTIKIINGIFKGLKCNLRILWLKKNLNGVAQKKKRQEMQHKSNKSSHSFLSETEEELQETIGPYTKESAL